VFELDQFIFDCRTAIRSESPSQGVGEVVARAVSEPGALIQALGEPTRGGLFILHQADDLTVFNVVWPPWMTVPPHNHLMWAVIGIYTGREDNIFWRRIGSSPDCKVEAVGARALSTRDTTSLGRDVIHSVTNPIPRLTGAIHVYGGDFFAKPRSEWDAETLLEQPSDGEKAARRFDEANRRLLGG